MHSEDDDSDNSENNEETHFPKGSLQGIYNTYFSFFNILFIYGLFYIDDDGLDEALLEMAYGGDKDDEYFEKFKKSISSIPEQIIRYFKII